jgi:hypothetical protein
MRGSISRISAGVTGRLSIPTERWSATDSCI